VYQGDELGQPNGPAGEPPRDRAGRDPMRTPMRWDDTAQGGFTTGEPWLPLGDGRQRNVAAERRDAASLLHLYRRLIGLRRELGDGFRLLDPSPGVLAYERGGHVVAINTTAQPRPAPAVGEPILETHEGALDGGVLARAEVQVGDVEDARRHRRSRL
jgi:alpha-glucosidase